ncbi:hypothetical protein PLESTM_001644300 [Pleodorina starrii]|nr:hypothetical protein PLESTM_001644300 [Pleodorina starrii]
MRRHHQLQQHQRYQPAAATPASAKPSPIRILATGAVSPNKEGGRAGGRNDRTRPPLSRGRGLHTRCHVSSRVGNIGQTARQGKRQAGGRKKQYGSAATRITHHWQTKPPGQSGGQDNERRVKTPNQRTGQARPPKSD